MRRGSARFLKPRVRQQKIPPAYDTPHPYELLACGVTLHPKHVIFNLHMRAQRGPFYPFVYLTDFRFMTKIAMDGVTSSGIVSCLLFAF